VHHLSTANLRVFTRTRTKFGRFRRGERREREWGEREAANVEQTDAGESREILAPFSRRSNIRHIRLSASALALGYTLVRRAELDPEIGKD